MTEIPQPYEWAIDDDLAVLTIRREEIRKVLQAFSSGKDIVWPDDVADQLPPQLPPELRGDMRQNWLDRLVADAVRQLRAIFEEDFAMGDLRHDLSGGDFSWPWDEEE